MLVDHFESQQDLHANPAECQARECVPALRKMKTTPCGTFFFKLAVSAILATFLVMWCQCLAYACNMFVCSITCHILIDVVKAAENLAREHLASDSSPPMNDHGRAAHTWPKAAQERLDGPNAAQARGAGLPSSDGKDVRGKKMSQIGRMSFQWLSAARMRRARRPRVLSFSRKHDFRPALPCRACMREIDDRLTAYSAAAMRAARASAASAARRAGALASAAERDGQAGSAAQL